MNIDGVEFPLTVFRGSKLVNPSADSDCLVEVKRKPDAFGQIWAKAGGFRDDFKARVTVQRLFKASVSPMPEGAPFLVAKCGNPHCCNHEHLEWTGDESIATHTQFAQYNEGCDASYMRPLVFRSNDSIAIKYLNNYSAHALHETSEYVYAYFREADRDEIRRTLAKYDLYTNEELVEEKELVSSRQKLLRDHFNSSPGF